jgi:hypothetical protein
VFCKGKAILRSLDKFHFFLFCRFSEIQVLTGDFSHAAVVGYPLTENCHFLPDNRTLIYVTVLLCFMAFSNVPTG